MAYFVYILYSNTYDKFYIGSTNNLSRRLEQHNKGKSLWAKVYRPWEIVHSERYPTRAEAMKKEKYFKSLKDKSLIRQYIAGWRSSTSRGS